MKRLLLICVLLGSATVYASGSTTVLDFALLDNNGAFHDLNGYRSHDAIVIVSQDNSDSLLTQAVAELNNIQIKTADKNIGFLMLNASPHDDRESINRIIKKNDIPFPILIDSTQLVAKSLGIETSNIALLIDPNSKQLLYRGPISADFATNQSGSNRDYLLTTINNNLKPNTIGGGHAKGKVIDYVANKPYDYQKDIAPILQKHCLQCHRENGIAPWAMNSYAMIQGWAPMIREVLMTRRMPPGQIDDYYGDFKNHNSLTIEETRALISWIDAGAPRGKGNDPLVDLTSPVANWSFGKPDKIIKIPAQEIPATGTIDYRYETVDLGIDKEVWIKGFEVKPGSSSVVHHISLDLIQGEEQKPRRGDGGFYSRLGAYVPGRQPTQYPDNVGKKLSKGSKLSLTLHYTASGKATVDESIIGFYFWDEEPTYEMLSDAAANWTFTIPPNVQEYPVTATANIYNDTYLYVMAPHMHFRGKRMKYTALYPDGREEVLLSVPNYQFNWQMQYELNEPVFLPAGTQIQVDGAFDNSSLNPFNPDSTASISYGNQSWEEMFFGFMEYRSQSKDSTEESAVENLSALKPSTWTGRWQWPSGPSTLVITGGSPESLQGYVYYRTSDYRSTFGSDDGSTAQLKGNQLLVKTKDDETFELSLSINDSGSQLFGRWSSPSGRVLHATFEKLK